MNEQKLVQDLNTFICLAALMVVGFFVIKIVF
jgi:hypothetical protein